MLSGVYLEKMFTGVNDDNLAITPRLNVLNSG